ncbi:hypothetical protein [Chitinophaga sp. LS1]|uniref:hypothetical protein n=1 Tax=Chitinophaga sp. LS1 TaxID=3051176 RepID=UPI002AAC325E|nr:hypothetical protein [Chitinophaga sp. LS1]WPV64608.1 hypothetical protein QQL36_22660 [Chitinophaga sp. LS1]
MSAWQMDGIGRNLLTLRNTPDWTDGLRPGNARTPSYRTPGGFYPGVLAQYVVMSEEWLVHAPVTLTTAEASTLPCDDLTAWFALAERARVRAGDTVLIPATGGVALFGLQIAKAHGAHVIVYGRAKNRERTMASGADHFIEKERLNMNIENLRNYQNLKISS